MKNLKVKWPLILALLKSEGFILVTNAKGLIHYNVDTSASVANDTAKYLNGLVDAAIEKKTIELDQDTAVFEAQSIINKK